MVISLIIQSSTVSRQKFIWRSVQSNSHQNSKGVRHQAFSKCFQDGGSSQAGCKIARDPCSIVKWAQDKFGWDNSA